MAPRRGPRLPADVAVHLPAGDHVLAVAPLAPDGLGAENLWAVATVSGVAVVTRDGVRWRREWVDVDHGSWSADTESLTVTWVDGAPERTLALAPEAGRRFPEAFRDRVQASVVHVERRTVSGLGDVRAMVRRSPDGTLLSQLVVLAARPLSLQEREAAYALESRARRAVGLDA